MNLKHKTGFLFKKIGATVEDTDSRSSLYQHPIIQKAINKTFFTSNHKSKGEGIAHPDLFDPFPPQIIALVLSAIECCIDEWAPGTRSEIAFTKDEYKSIYEDHLSLLNEYKNGTLVHNLMAKLQSRLLKEARLYAGVATAATAEPHRISKTVLEAALNEYQDHLESGDD